MNEAKRRKISSKRDEQSTDEESGAEESEEERDMNRATRRKIPPRRDKQNESDDERGAEERGAEERGQKRGQKRGPEERGLKRGQKRGAEKRGAGERGQKREAEEREAEEQEMNESKRKKLPPNRDEQNTDEESGAEEFEWESGAEEPEEERDASTSSYDAAYSSSSRNYPPLSGKQRAPPSPVYSQSTWSPVLHTETAADPVRKTSRTETGRLTRKIDASASSCDAAYSSSSRNYPPLSGKQRAPPSPVYSQSTWPPVLHTADKHRLNNIQENRERSKSESGGRDQQQMASKNNYKYYILALIVGVVIGIVVDRCLLWPSGTLKDTEKIGRNITKVRDGQEDPVKPDPVKPDPMKPTHPEEDFVPPKPKPDGVKVKVYSKVTGKTFGADRVLMERVKSMSRSVTVETTEDLQESHVVIVFCPITSRVGSDVDAAMTDITASCGQKPVILVLMHHTRDVDYSTAGRRWSDVYDSVVLDVHVLFHETKNGLLTCPKNDQAAGEILEGFQKYSKHKGS